MTTPADQTPLINQQQLEFWNGDAGRRWASFHEELDAMMAPLDDAVFERLDLSSASRVLDIGCGCGATTVRLARTAGEVTAIDISEPMLNIARDRALIEAHTVRFLQADAAAHSFDPDYFDLALSRFGVMFFGDPPSAFANVRRALKPGSPLTFLCWRALNENPWMMVPMSAVAQFVTPEPPPPPDSPGPFAFADIERVRGILRDAGFTRIDVEKIDTHLTIGAGTELEKSLAFFEKIGPVASMLLGKPPEVVAQARNALLSTLKQHHTEKGVSLGAACWLVTAR